MVMRQTKPNVAKRYVKKMINTSHIKTPPVYIMAEGALM
jgi:hypothetical protein